MAEQRASDGSEPVGFTRSLSVPILALLFALMLIYTRSPSGDPGSAVSISFPEVLGGENLRRGLINIAVLFGLSCLPGGLIGTVLGYLIVQNSKLAMASLDLLHIGQWAPFILWWVLIATLFIAPGQLPEQYFFLWTMCIPAVALGACYQFIRTRHILKLDWQTTASEMMKLVVLRGLLISLVIALSVRAELWVLYPGSENVVRHYVAASVFALFLIVVHWIYRSGIQHTVKLSKEIRLADLNRRNEASFWTAALIVLLGVAVWQLLNWNGYFRISPMTVFKAIVPLFSGGEIWRDLGVSLLELVGGVVFSGVLVFIISVTLLTNRTVRRWILPILSLTFAIPIVMFPAWHSWLLNRGALLFGGPPWTGTCAPCFVPTTTYVASLSFFPLMQTVWALREERELYKILFGIEQALPYAFVAMLYGEMMSATAGLGFAMITATAIYPYEAERGFAVYLITLSLLYGLSTMLRYFAKRINVRVTDQERVRNSR